MSEGIRQQLVKALDRNTTGQSGYHEIVDVVMAVLGVSADEWDAAPVVLLSELKHVTPGRYRLLPVKAKDA